jgi:enoyl-CoA hydratase
MPADWFTQFAGLVLRWYKEPGMTYENLIMQKEGNIARITLNRPQVLNALSIALLRELKEAVLEAGEDKGIALLVLTGSGRAFSSGADLQSSGNIKLENGRIGRVFDTAANSVIEAILNIPKVVIAMVNGHCYTGALEIVLACDLVVASEEARFGDTHVRWGIRPSWGMSQRLPGAVGLLKAKELSFTAEVITASQAERAGLVNMAVPAEKLEETVKDLAGKILVNSLEAVAAYKYLYNHTMRDRLEKGLEFEKNSEFVISDTQSRVDKFLRKNTK